MGEAHPFPCTCPSESSPIAVWMWCLGGDDGTPPLAIRATEGLVAGGGCMRQRVVDVVTVGSVSHL
jgi:hypothetical protein